MKIRAYTDWGYPRRVYHRGCDELCNSVFEFGLPYVGVVSFFSERATYGKGLWYTSGGSSRDDGTATIFVNTESPMGVHVSAEILTTGAAFEDDLGWDNEHPRIWIDAEVRELATAYEFYDDESDDFVSLDPDDVWDLIKRPA